MIYLCYYNEERKGGNNMSGHSKWATIHRKKGELDQQRGKIFQKIAKEIYVATRGTDGNPYFLFKIFVFQQFLQFFLTWKYCFIFTCKYLIIIFW